MWRPDPDALAAALEAASGVAFRGRLVTGGDYPGLELAPEGHHPGESFSLVVALEWRSLEISLRPGPYAGALISQMGRAGPVARNNFGRFCREMVGDRASVILLLNGEACDPRDPSGWPAEWSRLDLRLRRSPAQVNTEDHAANDREVLVWLRAFLSMVLALVPLELVEEEPARGEGLPEGALLRIEVNRYERSRINRANCIALHGCRCKACGFDFEDVYGDLGRGFIHVHHVVPVSQMGEGYVVDPWTDLVPLCPNCHAMAHRSNPPVSVELIRGVLAENTAAASVQC